MTQGSGDINIDPTAKVHPSVILEGIVTVGAYTEIGAGTVLTGHVTIGHHCIIACNVVIRGGWIGNYVHIYDCVCIEQGRPGAMGTTTAKAPDKLVIGDYCWVNHGATMHGTQMAEGSAIGLNTCCDYNTRIGKGAVLANGSATRVVQRSGAEVFDRTTALLSHLIIRPPFASPWARPTNVPAGPRPSCR